MLDAKIIRPSFVYFINYIYFSIKKKYRIISMKSSARMNLDYGNHGES